VTAQATKQAATDAAEAQTALLTRLVAGDSAAQEELVRQTIGRITAGVRRLLHCDEDVRDCVQETYLKAFEKIDTFRGDAQISTWLLAIARNCALMRLRSRARDPQLNEDLGEMQFDEFTFSIFPVAAQMPCPEKTVLDRDDAQRLRTLIEELPAAYRSVIVLRDLENMSTRETAEALDISETLVKVRLHRARNALRDKALTVFGVTERA